MRLMGLFFLVGCGAIDVALETSPCEDVDFNADAEVLATLDGEDVRVFRMPPCVPTNGWVRG